MNKKLCKSIRNDGLTIIWYYVHNYKFDNNKLILKNVVIKLLIINHLMIPCSILSLQVYKQFTKKVSG